MATRKEKPMPTTVLYSLLRAANPARALKGRISAPEGEKTDGAAKAAFVATLTAAQKSKSAREFTKALSGGGEQLFPHGAVVSLTVENQAVYTIVRVRFEDGTQIISVFPRT